MPLSREQQMIRLDRANQARSAAAELKRELRNGLSLPDALTDDRAAPVPVLKLLCSAPGVGRVRAVRVLRHARVSETRRVDELSLRDRAALIAELPACCGAVAA